MATAHVAAHAHASAPCNETALAGAQAKAARTPRLSLRIAVVCVCALAVAITLRERFFAVGQLRGLHHPVPASFSSTPASPAPAHAAAVAQPPPPTSEGRCERRRAGRVFSAAALRSGWKRTLPPAVAASAAFFDHERTLREVFCDVPVGGIVWLTFSNSAFRELALNWAAHVYRLRKERSFAVAALDQPFQQALLAEGVPYFAFDHGVLGDMRSNVSGFRRLGALKGELVLQVLRARRHVLLSDVDVVWLDDPTPHLRALGTADVMSATDCLSPTADDDKSRRAQGANRCAYNPGNARGHAAFNTGVLFFRDTTAAAAVAAAWRSRLLSVEPSAWLDDQLAFNELVWHGFRNHNDGAVRGARADGRVIEVRMGQEEPPPPRPGQGQGQGQQALAQRLPRLPNPKPPAAWLDGWAWLWNASFSSSSSSSLRAAAEGSAGAVVGDAGDEALGLASSSPPSTWTLAPLPARHFCSGHLYWEQQGMEGRGCASVHTTFVEGGNAGKL